MYFNNSFAREYRQIKNNSTFLTWLNKAHELKNYDQAVKVFNSPSYNNLMEIRIQDKNYDRQKGLYLRTIMALDGYCDIPLNAQEEVIQEMVYELSKRNTDPQAESTCSTLLNTAWGHLSKDDNFTSKILPDVLLPTVPEAMGSDMQYIFSNYPHLDLYHLVLQRRLTQTGILQTNMLTLDDQWMEHLSEVAVEYKDVEYISEMFWLNMNERDQLQHAMDIEDTSLMVDLFQRSVFA